VIQARLRLLGISLRAAVSMSVKLRAPWSSLVAHCCSCLFLNLLRVGSGCVRFR